MWLVDPIYRKFTAKAFQNLTSPEFFEFFMGMMRNGEQQFQFSNRKIKIDVDESWIDIIEATIPALIEITRNPRVIITQEELITNIVQAKKIDSAVVKHLCAHSYLVDAIDENGEVRPSKVVNFFKEETWDTYENRFVYTLLKMTYDFVTKRYNDMRDALNDEFGATLRIDASGSSKMETLSIKTEMKIKQTDELDDADGNKKSAFARIKDLFEKLNMLMETRFAKEMKNFSVVRPPLVPTNAIKKNPYLRKCHKLWDFLLSYYDAGFTVNIIEQNPEINQKFEQDIFDNIMFTYIILKGYLEDNRDRALDRDIKARRRQLRPRYIKEIIEETVRNFNLSEVEVRKILIEELTKEQLLREERAERYRLVEEKRREEQEKRAKAEQERARQKKEKELLARKLAREKAKEKARKAREKEKAALRAAKEKAKKAEADAKRLTAIEEELQQQLESIERRRNRKIKSEEQKATPKAAKKPRKTEKNPKAKRKKAPEKQPEELTALPAETVQSLPSEAIEPAEQPAPTMETPTESNAEAELEEAVELEKPIEAEVAADEVDEPLAVDFKTDEMGIADSPDNERMEEKTKSPLGGLLRLFRRG